MGILKRYDLSDLGIKGVLSLKVYGRRVEYEKSVKEDVKRIFEEFKRVESYLIANFIVEAKNFFEEQKGEEGIKYQAINATYKSVSYDDNENLPTIPLTKVIIVPEGKVDKLEEIVAEDQKAQRNFENSSPLDAYLKSVNGIQFSNDFGYEMYNELRVDDKGNECAINDELVTFDPRFKDLVARLIKVRIDRPDISMEFAMQLVLNELKTGKIITGDEVEISSYDNHLYNLLLHMKSKFKLYMTPEQEVQLRQINTLKRFKYVNPSSLKDFIVKAQTILTGVEYKSATFVIVPKNNSIASMPEYMEYIVPGDKIQLVYDNWTEHRPGNQRKVYEMLLHLSGENYFNFDSLDYYEMYSMTKGIDQKLIKFNPEFNTIFNDLVCICLDNPDITMEKAFDKEIINLKNRMSSKVKTLTKEKKG